MRFLNKIPAENSRAPRGPGGRRRGLAAFTLVELLVAMTVLLVLVLMMVGIANQTDKIWRTSRTRIEAFQGARNAFERITSNLAQATLNTYLDYYNAQGKTRADEFREAGGSNPYTFASLAQNFTPVTYDRASELQFVCGQSSLLIAKNASANRPTHAVIFECPIGNVSDPTAASGSPNDFKNLNRVVNAMGYYIDFTNQNDPTTGTIPTFISSGTTLPAEWRYRLMEFNQPSQQLAIYNSAVTYEATGSTPTWFYQAVNPTSPTSATVTATSLPIADNIVALIIRPKSANPSPDPSAALPTEIAPSYAYDTKLYSLSQTNATLASTNPITISKNQLPPLVQVTLVAIDSDSALRLAAQYGSTPPPLVTSTMFTLVGAPPTDQYTADLNTLESTLLGLHLNYRVFVEDVSIPEAKWSQPQAAN